MGPPCKTCIHPDREMIEVDLAMFPSVREVSDKWEVNRRSLQRHKQNHMTQEQIARIRGMTPTEAEVNIDDLVRKGGQEAVVGLSRLIQECKDQADKCDRMNLAKDGATYRKLQLDCYREKAKIAALYPGRKSVTNNNLVLGDVGHVFDMLDTVLRPFPEARQAVALAFSQSQQAVLEHEP